jgi:hypothetical protein
MHPAVCMMDLAIPSMCRRGDECTFGHDKVRRDLTTEEYRGLCDNFGSFGREMIYDPAKLKALDIYDDNMGDAAAHLSSIPVRQGMKARDRSGYVPNTAKLAAKKDRKAERAARDYKAAAMRGAKSDGDDTTVDDDNASTTSALTDTSSASSALSRDSTYRTYGDTAMTYSEVGDICKDAATMNGDHNTIAMFEKYEGGDETRYCMMVKSAASRYFADI